MIYRPSPGAVIATSKHHVKTHTILIAVAFTLFWVPVLIFAGLADEVSEHTPLLFDSTIIMVAHAVRSPFLTNVFLLATSLGQPLVVGGTGLILLIILLARRYYRGAALILVGIGGATGANLILKFIFARTRPSQLSSIITETSYSFPSGHAMVSSAFVCSVILLMWHTRYRTPVIILGFFVTFIIGASRVYLGVHYPSDVVAGWCVGLLWAVIAGSLLINRPFQLGHRLIRLLHHAG